LNQKFQPQIASKGATTPIACYNSIARTVKVEPGIGFEEFPVYEGPLELNGSVSSTEADGIDGCDVLHRHVFLIVLVLVGFLAIIGC
jgi:hypothetical protein